MNIFKQIFVSLYSPKSIALFRFQGIGKTILYVFLLTLLSIIPTVSYFSYTLISGVESAQVTINEKLPDFTIENGQLNSEQNEPLIIEEKDITIFFDSSGELSIDDLDSSIASIALLKNDIALTAAGNVEQLSYSMMDDVFLTKDDLSQVLDTVDSSLAVIIPIFVIIIYLFSSGMKFIEVSVLALIGLLLGSITAKTVQYRHLWRMSAYSITIPTLFFTIMDAIQTTVPSGFLIHWAVSIIILFLALKEIPMPKKKETIE